MVKYLYFNNIKKLRENHELTQQQVANILNCKRSTYNGWERGAVMIPINIADKLSLYYKVKLSYIIGIDSSFTIKKKIKSMDYQKMLQNLAQLKKDNKHTYEEIGEKIGCTKSTCLRYFTGEITIPMDKLIFLSKLYQVDIDKLCNKY